jgi:hypothetical protein
MVVASLLTPFGPGTLLWLLFALAVYALPFFVGMTIALHLHDIGAGLVAVLGGGLLAGALTLLAGQLPIVLARHPVLQCAVAALYAGPAALAGYHAVNGLSGIGIASDTARIVLAAIGAVLVGGTAWIRMGDLGGGATPPGDPDGAAVASAIRSSGGRHQEPRRSPPPPRRLAGGGRRRARRA